MKAVKRKFQSVIQDGSNGIFPAELDAQVGLRVLAEYLLGEDFYITYPGSVGQENCEIVFQILKKYSKDFRRELRNMKQ